MLRRNAALLQRIAATTGGRVEVGGLVRDPAQEATQRWQIADRVERPGARERGIVGGGMDRAVTDWVERNGVGATLAARDDVVPFDAGAERACAKRAECGCRIDPARARVGFGEPGLAPYASDHAAGDGRERMKSAHAAIAAATIKASGRRGCAVTRKIT